MVLVFWPLRSFLYFIIIIRAIIIIIIICMFGIHTDVCIGSVVSVVRRRPRHALPICVTVLRCPLPDRVHAVCVQVVTPSLGWYPLSYFPVVQSPLIYYADW